MTVRENMGFALKLSKVDKHTIDAKVDEAAAILDLQQHLDRKPANLPAASASASRWAARSCAVRRRS
jgi:ABC-type sugar transport system ATPase subunit